MISRTPELRDLLNLPSEPPKEDVFLLRSKHYVAVSCDLGDTKALNEALKNVVDLRKCLIICIAEVSMTYMDVTAADSLLRWAGLCNNSMSIHTVALVYILYSDVASSILPVGTNFT